MRKEKLIPNLEVFFSIKTDDEIRDSIQEIKKAQEDFRKEEVNPETLITLMNFITKGLNLDSIKAIDLIEFCVRLTLCSIYEELCQKELFRREMED